MKKNLLFLIIFVSSIYTLKAQDAQDTFWGCKFGSPIYQMNAALKRAGYDGVYMDKNEIKVYDIRFGGYGFSSATFEYVNNQFYYITFSNYFIDKDSALAFFTSVYNSLYDKYGELSDFTTERVVDYSFCGSKNCAGVNMTKKQTRSKGGDLYYYVDLFYFNFDLMKKVSEKSKNEL